MTKRLGVTGFRLLDGVIVASVALLALKMLGVMAWMTAAPDPNAPVRPGFAQVLVHARTNYEPLDVAITGSVPEKKDETPAPAEASAPAPPSASAKIGSQSERQILERLGERREELRQKDRDAEVREKLLEESERRLDARLDGLKAVQEKAEAAPDVKAEAETGNLKNLVTMYETMKPKDAARVFDRLPQNVLVPVVKLMNPRKMADVLAAMSPATAEKLTVALADRKQTGSVADRSVAALPPGELPAIEAAPRVRR